MSIRRASIPPLPQLEIPIADLICERERAFSRLAKRKSAETWLPITFAEAQPFGVVWFGDPHLDDDGTNWPQLLADIDTTKRAEGCYAACIGDFRNNWVGRLVRLYAQQQVTHPDAQRLAKWFLRDAGIPWVLNVLGNHDVWNEGGAVMGLIADQAIYMPEWEAKVTFRAGSHSWRVHAAHNFKGHSRFNKNHGLTIAANEYSDAELFVGGHLHTSCYTQYTPDRNDRVVHLVRAAGYKKFDQHAVVNGFAINWDASSVMTIFNPDARTRSGRIMVFTDLEAGADFLGHLRKGSPCRTVRPISKRPSPSADRVTAPSRVTPRSRKRSKAK